MVKLSKNREITIPHDDFSITWKFPLTTEIEITKARSILRKSVMETKIQADEDYVFDVYLMNSIHKATGFADDETGEEITELTLEAKKAIYDYIKMEVKGYWEKVVVAFNNIKGKNSKSGETLS